MGKRKGWEFSLQVKGIVGRDRTPKTYYITLLETDHKQETSSEHLETLVSKKLLEVKYKYGTLAIVKYPVLLDEYISNSNKASRKKVIEVNNGQVVWRSQGYNLPPVVKADKKK